MRLLLPEARSLASDEQLTALAELYPRHDGDGPWVRANFVSTLDGAAAGDDHLSNSISGDADQRVFGVLRGLADVVLVGAATAAAEGYRRLVLNDEQRAVRDAAGLTGTPTLALVTRSLHLPDTVVEPRDGGGPVVVICAEEAPTEQVARARSAFGDDAVIFAGEGQVDPKTAVAQLVDRGLSQILCEGGPSWMAELAGAGCVDELCLSWSPLTVGGSAPRILNGSAVAEPLQSWSLGHLLEEDGTLIGRWVKDRPASAS